RSVRGAGRALSRGDQAAAGGERGAGAPGLHRTDAGAATGLTPSGPAALASPAHSLLRRRANRPQLTNRDSTFSRSLPRHYHLGSLRGVNDGAPELPGRPRGRCRGVLAGLALVQSPVVLQAVDAAARPGPR